MKKSTKQVPVPNIKVILVEPTKRGPFKNTMQSVIQDNGQFCFSTAAENSVIFAYYPAEDKEQLSDQVYHLRFIQVGSQEPADVRAYSKTCTSIEFHGHIESTNAVFEIIEQLPELKSVNFFVRNPQRKYYPEVVLKTPRCPSVKKLEIAIDRDFFESCYCKYRVPSCAADKCMGMRSSLVRLAECLLIQAKGSFPNLKKIDLQLPETDTIVSDAYSLHWSFRWFRRQLQLGSEQAPSCTNRKQVDKGMPFRRDGKHWRKLGFRNSIKK